MGNKKKKRIKTTEKTPNKAPQKLPEPTTLEMAFRQAEVRKKAEAPKEQKPMANKAGGKSDKIPPEATIPKKNAEQPQSDGMPSAKSFYSPQKKKSVYIPPPKQKESHKADHPRSLTAYPAGPTQRVQVQKKEVLPKNLSIKRIDDDRISLNIDLSINPKSKESLRKNGEFENHLGKAQVHGGNARKESDVVIGFDFGTSSSKLVIRDSGRQTAYAVPFNSLACEGNIYLLPTRVFINSDGTVSLSKGDNEYNDLKIHLMATPLKIVFEATAISKKFTSSELAVGYIAIAIRHARLWFLKKTKSIYKDTHIHWHINLGIPSKDYDDQSTKDSFRVVLLAAWRASMLDGSISILQIKEHFQSATELIIGQKPHPEAEDINTPWLHPDFVNTHPEVIMEVVGYARSPMRTRGLHLLVDIGATTMDAATFIIHSKDGEDVFPLLETRVEQYGTMVLHKKRMDCLKRILEKNLQEKNCIDPNKPLPDPDHYEIEIDNNAITENDAKFFQNCRKAIGELIRDTKNRRDPYSEVWENGLPVFVCGGGRRLAYYTDMIKLLGMKIAESLVDFMGVVVKEIPKPKELDAPELFHEDYDRLAVAYGLSFTADEIGEIIPESKLCDIQKTKRKLNCEDRYVGKEMC